MAERGCCARSRAWRVALTSPSPRKGSSFSTVAFSSPVLHPSTLDAWRDNCFAVIQLLQYRGTGRWGDYLTGERAYIVLSLVAKSLLAWQVFANVLIEP